MFPTWGELVQGFCSSKNVPLGQPTQLNPFYEDFANRRYNYAASHDKFSCRLIFLKSVLQNNENKTLCRKGRFIWCSDLNYEGKDDKGFRQISFVVDKGKKRFFVSEGNILCLPSHICVNNSRYLKSKYKTFFPFSSVFSYKNSIKMMAKNYGCDVNDFRSIIDNDNPYKPGTLVSPKLGYFHPEIDPNKLDREMFSKREHPCGIILGPAPCSTDYLSKEFYRVRFGDITYEKIHPVQMEIINEV